MKKRVLTVSLSLLVCLCCCFSGFGSVNVFADSNTYPQYIYTLPFAYSQHYAKNGTVFENRNFTKGDDYNYHLTHNGTVWDTAFEFFMYIPNTTHTDYIYSFPVNSDVYDYYVFHSFTVDNIDNNTVITGYDFGYYDENNNFIVNDVVTDRIDKELIYRSNVTGTYSKSRSYQYTGKLNLDFNGTYNLGVLRYYGNGSLYGEDTYLWSLCVIALPKGDTDAYNEIIAAIDNQTTSLGGKLDSIDQTIQDQYEIEDEEDFGFSDIQQQYEEKMGVLTFGTETTLQMLDLFSPSNAGEAYIRVPGWSMEVQGETYQIWDEYVFYFDSIEENFPFLVITMRTFTVAMFYVAIVGYITKVYERNFLAK